MLCTYGMLMSNLAPMKNCLGWWGARLAKLDPQLYYPRREKTYLRWFANNKDTGQPAHPRRLISAFVESIISKLATSEIFDLLASLRRFESRFVGNPKDRFCRLEAQ